MTLREAVTQAQVELGISRKKAELSSKLSDGCLPEAAPFANCPVRPGSEREFIESLKTLLRYLDAHPREAQACLKRYMAQRTGAN